MEQLKLTTPWLSLALPLFDLIMPSVSTEKCFSEHTAFFVIFTDAIQIQGLSHICGLLSDFLI